MKKVLCVISHTHWDREWYMSLEKSKIKLVDLIDHLLVILENNPEYIFHLDAQTIVLDDYLEIRPGRKEILKKHISEHRIVVGPWYLQNDFYLTSGEATVRNLLKGKEVAREFGACGKTGYAPDQFGNISQLPQILDNFGLEGFVFGRGYSIYKTDENGNVYREKRPSEFIWEGADGTRMLAIHMCFWYNNAQRFSADTEKALKLAKRCEKIFEGVALTPYLLLTNGVDHLEPQPDLCDIIKEIDPKLGEGKHILQYNLDNYVRDVAKYIDDNNVELPEHKGELRDGSDWEILASTLSSRHYLKVANVRTQSKFENCLEPLYTMLETSGMKGIYPVDHMKYLWKKLIANHPHDSICGCSCDAVHSHMENRYAEMAEFSKEMENRAMIVAATHSTVARQNPDDFVLTFANTSNRARSSVEIVNVYLPPKEGLDSISITDVNGNPAKFAVINKESGYNYDVFSPINLPGSLVVDKYTVYVWVENIAPYSFKSFLVKNSEAKAIKTELVCANVASWENEYLAVSVDSKGHVNLTEKETGRHTDNCLWLEDTGDFGDSYVYRKGAGDTTPITTKRLSGKVNVTANNDYAFSCDITYKLMLPASSDDMAGVRTTEKLLNTVILTVSLKKGQPWLEVGYTVTNVSENHRLRLVVDTDVSSSKSVADIPFDIVRHGEEALFPGVHARVLPNSTFAAIEAGSKGFAVLTEGAHEYEHLNRRSLAFTILRARGNIGSKTDAWLCPENQCKRTMGGRIALLPYSGKAAEAGIPDLSVQFRTSLLNGFDSCDGKKFCGGRPAVQDTEINELFFFPDEYPNVSIGDNEQPFKIEGEGILVTATKRSEDDTGKIIRILNISEKTTDVSVTVPGEIYLTKMDEEQRSFYANGKAVYTLTPKKIVTLYIK